MLGSVSIALFVGVSLSHACLIYPTASTTPCNATDGIVECVDEGLTEVPQDDIPCSAYLIDLSRNEIGTLHNGSFRGIDNVTMLFLARNGLTQLDNDAFAGLGKLAYLDLSYNKLRAWPYLSAACASVVTLDLQENELAGATNTLTCLESLQRLDISGNEMHILPNLSAVGETLQTLNVMRNDIRDITVQDVEPLTTIHTLNLHSNQLVNFSFVSVLSSTLDKLVIDRNSMGELDVSLIPYMANGRIDFAFNSLTHIPPLGPACAGVEFISFNDNDIVSLDNDTFQFCTSATQLHLGFNRIEQLSSVNFTVIGRSLSLFNISSNRISSVPANAFDNLLAAKYIELNYNQIHTFPNFGPSSSTLTYLYLAYAAISYIDYHYLDQLVSLISLDLEGNGLDSIPDVPGPGNTLRILLLSYNAFTSFPSLTSIGGNIEILVLTGNNGISRLSQDDLAPLHSLRELQLGSTSIHTVPAVHLPERLLDLSNTPLHSMSPGLTALMATSTALLKLRDTDLVTVPTTCGGDSNGLQLDLCGSPVDLCSCDMVWLKLLSTGTSVQVDPVLCSGLQWTDASYQELLNVCTTPPAGRYNDLLVEYQAGIAGCNVPMTGPMKSAISRGHCLMWCMQQPGCTGINYSPVKAATGHCILVAPAPDSVIDDELPSDKEWQYYAVMK